jgi:hypothetical protein
LPHPTGLPQPSGDEPGKAKQPYKKEAQTYTIAFRKFGYSKLSEKAIGE